MNINIIDLNNKIKSTNNLYKIQINNRINEIDQLNTQLDDLHKLLNIGLDLSTKKDIYFDTKLDKKEKN